ncbi:hypothetical protein EGW08_013040 [Elysia chlorotica]|uniref:N-acetyltransferase domain-containing protein n=1 Tax=Elysia chlorotica TaxID=188477 RepID=A0A3S0ZJJ9_ELYCH|nr:hypothetical protein EGW08_013040 [Elysia chlorotica]
MLRRCSCEVKRFVSSANRLKGMNNNIRKEAISPYLERCQHDQSQSFSTSSLQNFSRTSSDKNDLSRFLIEIGTDPKEARYWLKNFTLSAEPSKVFMVISVDDEVMQNQAQLETFSSSISFLYRNNMAPLILYGAKKTAPSFKSMKDTCIWNALRLSNMLEQQGVFTRVLYPGCGVIMGDSDKAGMPEFETEQLRLDPHILRSGFETGHLPILLSFGETDTGQMFAVDTWTLTTHVARLLQPMKVMLVNSQGGFLDEHGKVIANINLPTDLDTVEQKPWRTPDKVEMMIKVNSLLADLPGESSVVITSADTMLRELFSHRGSGTFFRCTEAVHKYKSLQGIDLDRLRVLLHSTELVECVFLYAMCLVDLMFQVLLFRDECPGSGTFFRCTEAVHKYKSLQGIDLDRLRVLLHRASGGMPSGPAAFPDLRNFMAFAISALLGGLVLMSRSSVGGGVSGGAGGAGLLILYLIISYTPYFFGLLPPLPVRNLFVHRSFKRPLSASYFEDIESHIHAIYLSESYSGVAIILKGLKTEVRYLCKFAVTDKAQGQGIGELLWDTVWQAEPSLFWRSKTANPINTWYFKKCEGSWNNPMWTVFWYGVQDPSLSTVLITEALTRPGSFDEVDKPRGRDSEDQSSKSSG